MYKLIIVEDELFVRIGLENAIKWEDYQIEIVGSVCNGEEALALYRQYGADIIITDIKMPVMDGIELIREVRKIDKAVKFIILTCMEDFHMAQQAMKYAVSNYFTKYDLKIDELEACLVEICKELISKGVQASSAASPQGQRITADELEQNNRIFEQNDDTSSVMEKYKIDNALYCVAEISVKEKSGGQQQELGPAVKNVIIQLLKTQGVGRLIAVFGFRIVILYHTTLQNQSTADLLTEIRDSLRHIMQMLFSYFDLTAYAFTSLLYDDIFKTSEQLLQLQKNKYLPFYLPDKVVFDNTEDDEHEKASLLVSTSLQEVIACYKENFNAEYEEEFCYFEERIAKSDLSDIDYIKNLFFHWGQLLMTIMRLPHEKANSLASELKPKTESANSFVEMVQSLMDFIVKIKISADETSNMSNGIIMAIDYIRTHLDEPMTLTKLSEHVGFSAGYLSYIFKREINMSFTDFLLKMRIKQAKLLLQQTDDKLYSIAEQTGFQDASYFNRVFRRVVGVTPNKFRAANGKGGGHDEAK